eukprot:776456-Heterocapsa_arctica.AAC.1
MLGPRTLTGETGQDARAVAQPSSQFENRSVRTVRPSGRLAVLAGVHHCGVNARLSHEADDLGIFPRSRRRRMFM